MEAGLYESKILGKINAVHIEIGKGVVVEEDVVITGKDGKAKSVRLGDFCFIGRGTRIIVPEFCLGDYSKLNSGSFLHGVNPLRIGRNCWIGGNVVLDSMGGLDLSDNVGIGAQSQIWTHAQFGDIVEGCRFYSRKYMHIGKDAWLVGHCIVSPVEIGERSMAMAGSVVTKDMLPNHIYGGVPAVDLTHKIGNQFEERTVEEKANKLQELIDDFYVKHPEFTGHLKVIRSDSEVDSAFTCFNVSNRTYTKMSTPAEVVFLKENVPLIKFIPNSELDFYVVGAPVSGSKHNC